MNAVIKQLHDAPAAPGSKVVEYSRTEVALADLRARFGNVVFDMTTAAGDKSARTARAEIKGYRTALETMRVDLKAPLLDRQRLIDQEAKRITAELIALEEPIDAQIKLEEKRKADEKAARELADKARNADIRKKIDELRAIPVGLMDATPEQLANAIADLEEFRATREVFGEFADEAHNACTDALMKVSEMRTAAIRRAEEAAQLAAERAALAKQRAEQDERERLAAAERAEQERKDREARQAEEARQRAEREAHEAKMAAERAQIERQQAEIAAEQRRKQKEVDDAQAAARAEIARQQAALDADRQRIADEAAARQRAEEEAAAAKVQAEADRLFAAEQARVASDRAAEKARAAREAAETAARFAADTAIRNAAPAMLEALEKMLDCFVDDPLSYQYSSGPVIEMARDAIALARPVEAEAA